MTTHCHVAHFKMAVNDLMSNKEQGQKVGCFTTNNNQTRFWGATVNVQLSVIMQIWPGKEIEPWKRFLFTTKWTLQNGQNHIWNWLWISTQTLTHSSVKSVTHMIFWRTNTKIENAWVMEGNTSLHLKQELRLMRGHSSLLTIPLPILRWGFFQIHLDMGHTAHTVFEGRMK